MGVFDPCSGQLVVNETADQRRTYSRVAPVGSRYSTAWLPGKPSGCHIPSGELFVQRSN